VFFIVILAQEIMGENISGRCETKWLATFPLNFKGITKMNII